MGILNQLEQWSSTHHPRWLVFLRVPLGLALFIKGITFFYNSEALTQLIAFSGFGSAANVGLLSMAITWAHFLGGVLLVIGLFTRWAALLQIPILLGAVIFVNAQKGFFVAGSELLFSIVILGLLIFFFVEGGGPLSVDNYAKKYRL